MPHVPYTLDGHSIPSVTEVIGMWGDADPLIGWACWLQRKRKSWEVERDYAACVGSVAHAMVEGYLEDKTPDQPTDDWLDSAKDDYTIQGAMWEAVPCASEICKWLVSMGVPRGGLPGDRIEQRMVSKSLRVGGTCDYMSPQLGIVADWKTSKQVRISHKIQLGAYMLMAEEADPNLRLTRGYVVAAPRKGGLHVCKLERSELEEMGRAFVALREVFRIAEGR